MKVLTKKNKNRYTIIIEGEGMLTYTLDFNTGIFYDGDKALEDCPIKLDYLTADDKEDPYLQNTISYITVYHLLKKEERAIFCSYMERFAALGLRFNMDFATDENPMYPNITAFCYIFQHTPINLFSPRDNSPLYASTIAQTWVRRLLKDLQASFPDVPSIRYIVEEVASFWCMVGKSRSAYISLIKFFLRQKFHVFEKQTITRLMRAWMIAKSKTHEPYDSCPSHGFAIELVETEKRAKSEEEAAIDENLHKNNDLPYLYFEDDTFICKPLLSCAEFRDEATKQENCVARIYIDIAAEGKTHIVSIRRKVNPTASCITCEIKNYEIVQYLRAHNSHDFEEDEGAFYKKLEIHLRDAKRHDLKFDGTTESCIATEETQAWPYPRQRLADLI